MPRVFVVSDQADAAALARTLLGARVGAARRDAAIAALRDANPGHNGYDFEVRRLLEKRFGAAKADGLVKTYQTSWITAADLDEYSLVGGERTDRDRLGRRLARGTHVVIQLDEQRARLLDGADAEHGRVRLPLEDADPVNQPADHGIAHDPTSTFRVRHLTAPPSAASGITISSRTCTAFTRSVATSVMASEHTSAGLGTA